MILLLLKQLLNSWAQQLLLLMLLYGKCFGTLVRAGAPPVSHIDPGNGHLHVAGCPGQVRVRQAAVSSISTVEAQLLGRLLQAALLHPCHFRVGGPLPEFHQSLPWSELLVWSLWSTPYSQSRDIYDLNARLRGIPSDGAPLAPTTWGQLIIDNLA